MTPPDWVTWALQALILGFVATIWLRLELLTRANHELALELAKGYLPKSDWATEYASIRHRLHELEGWKASAQEVMKMYREHVLNAVNGNHTDNRAP